MSCETSCISIKNTGFPDSFKVAGEVISFHFLKRFDASGNYNQIDYTATMDLAVFNALLNASSTQSRLLPLPESDNVTNERPEDIFEDLGRRRRKVRSSNRTAVIELVGYDFSYYKKLTPLACQKKLGAYAPDDCGNYIGDGRATGFLRPAPIEDGTMSIRWIPATDDAASRIMISWDWKNTFSDSDWAMIECKDFASDVDVREITGLIDLFGGTAANVASTSFDMRVYNDIGGAKGTFFPGLTATELEVYNKDTASAVVTTVSENTSAETYTFGIAAQTPGDKLIVRVKSGVNGYDDTNLQLTEVTAV